MKKPSSRSQRGSRGIKGKHVVQICVLLGVCIWLIYQVKYSHDKKKEIYETDGEKLLDKEDGLVKLGRKDLLPGYHKNENEEEEEKESKVVNGTHEEEEEKEEEEVAEEEEEDKSKLGEEVVEEDEEENKHEEDDIDEQDQSKTTEDEETNHADEIDMTVDEAREEHYKADDASSAVSHESSRILNTEKLNESSDNSTGGAQENNGNAIVSEVEVQKEPILKFGEAVEKTTTEVKDGDSETSRGETVNGNSTEAVLEASGFLQNETRIMQERSQEDSTPPSGSSELQSVIKLEQTGNESAPNITVSANVTNIGSIQDESRNSSSVIENISGLNTTEVKENTRSEGDDETGEYKESSNVFSTEQTEEANDDTTSESTMLQEEREALTDPQTLPDIRIEGNEEDEEEAISTE
ncbi:unnamed protein product [Eruca vesicaria subsp. sativa]|uniref:Uncharacterized protein n=1 Tax=Eruca vesicaria subsp. sativa TaxID=29727 RepID=A0ABC8JIG5_ERUVS|nr:unnamed protein product [Eruca vesicaria subsp. sativa]